MEDIKVGGYSHFNGISFFNDILKINAISNKNSIEYQIKWISIPSWLRKWEDKFLLNIIFMIVYYWKIMDKKYKIFISFLIVTSILEEFFHIDIFNKLGDFQIDVKWIYATIMFLILLNIKKIKRLFQYHGAEHKVINTYASYGYVDEYLVKNAPRFNKRCGSNMAMIQIIFYFILWLFKIDSIIIHLLTFIISFQIMRKIIQVEGKWDRYINLLQWITVLEPEDEQIYLATKAFQKMQEAHGIYVKEINSLKSKT